MKGVVFLANQGKEWMAQLMHSQVCHVMESTLQKFRRNAQLKSQVQGVVGRVATQTCWSEQLRSSGISDALKAYQ